MILVPDGCHFLRQMDEGLSPGPATRVGTAAGIAGIESHHIMVRTLREIFVPLRQQRRSRLGNGRAYPLLSFPGFPSARVPFLGMLAEELVRARPRGRHQRKG